MSQISNDRYQGIQVLELMDEAKNYNSFLFKLVVGAAHARSSILDFGAGTGTVARRMVAAGYGVQCIEQDESLGRRMKESGLTVHTSFAAIGARKVDYIYSLNVLEHIEDDLGALRQLRDHLRPNGRLLIYVPAFPLLYSSFDRAVGHCRRYRRGELIDRLRQLGFDIEEARYCDSLGFFAALAFKVLARRETTIKKSGLLLYDRFVFPISRVIDLFCRRLLGKNLLVIARRERDSALG